jgi:hypothetical protein
MMLELLPAIVTALVALVLLGGLVLVALRHVRRFSRVRTALVGDLQARAAALIGETRLRE